MDELPYQVGRANDPQPDDPRFGDEMHAIAYAQRECLGNAVFGVWKWENDTPIVVCLVYQGDMYHT